MVVTVDLAALDLDEYPTRGGLLRVAFPFDSAVGTASTAAMLVELEPGGVLPTHADSAEEAILVLEGAAELNVNGSSDSLSEGVVAVVPAMVPHSIRNVGQTHLRVLGFFSSAGVLATFARPLTEGGPRSIVIGAPFPLAVAAAE